MSRATALAAVARLDWAEVRRSRWAAACLGIYVLLAALFVLVGLRESSVLGFTGTSRVLFSSTHALVLLLPLFGLALTGQVINRARSDGTLELLLSQPLGPGRFLTAITLNRSLALALPLVITIGLLAGFGIGQVAEIWTSDHYKPVKDIAQQAETGPATFRSPSRYRP